MAVKKTSKFERLSWLEFEKIIQKNAKIIPTSPNKHSNIL
jgi:hypothetical protein